MDGDPISGFQDLKWLTLKNLKVESKSDTEASVTTTVLVQSDRSGPEKIKFILKREAGAWKIDDIKAVWTNFGEMTFLGFLR
jgi:ABC-type transporter MlaC component